MPESARPFPLSAGGAPSVGPLSRPSGLRISSRRAASCAGVNCGALSSPVRAVVSAAVDITEARAHEVR